MTSRPLDNLVRIGSLKQERCSQAEFDGLVRSGKNRLHDAQIKGMTFDGRFDLTYNASHAWRLRRCGGIATARTTAMWSFSALRTRSAWSRRNGRFWRPAISGATRRNMKAISKPMSNSLPI